MKKLLAFLSVLLIVFTACDTSKNLDYLDKTVKYSIKLTYDKNIFSDSDCHTLVGNIYLINSSTLIDGGVKEDKNSQEIKITGEYNSETTEVNGDLIYLFTTKDGNTSFEKVGYINGNLYRDYGEGEWAVSTCEGTWEAVREME